MDCAKACLNQAIQIAGSTYTVDDLMRILIRDQGFWGSQGGVTFSGGEPLFQSEFLLAVLEKCRSGYMHTTVETSAHTDTDVLMKTLKWTDWMFIDIKHMDSAAHRAATGADNELILRNIEMAASAAWDGRLIIRVPIVPGYNDTVENLRATAVFMTRLNLKEAHLLPFHQLGNSKYEQLDLEYEYKDVPSPSRDALSSHQEIFETAGLQCYVGSDTPF
jgi:pyruvate formate lyase activating enzyme